MALEYLFDTNAASDLMKGQQPMLTQRFVTAAQGSIALSAITEAELRYGAARRPESVRLRIAVEATLANLPVLPWDSAAARAYGHLRAHLERVGRPLSSEDLLIAAHALSQGLTLVTRDQAFSIVDGLRTQDWTQ
jgi:tRNA(fMet)-specific endonuclease VapC